MGLGFAGVILMVRPGGDLFDWAALLPILCSVAYAGSMIMARVMGSKDTAAAMAFWGNLAFLACAAALWFGAQPEVMVAVTGTNGKTSVAAFCRQIWAAMGLTSASMGTLGVVSQKDGQIEEPNAEDLNRVGTIATIIATILIAIVIVASSTWSWDVAACVGVLVGPRRGADVFRFWVLWRLEAFWSIGVIIFAWSVLDSTCFLQIGRFRRVLGLGRRLLV